jgi:hypothetical protein
MSNCTQPEVIMSDKSDKDVAVETVTINKGKIEGESVNLKNAAVLVGSYSLEELCVNIMCAGKLFHDAASRLENTLDLVGAALFCGQGDAILEALKFDDSSLELCLRESAMTLEVVGRCYASVRKVLRFAAAIRERLKQRRPGEGVGDTATTAAPPQGGDTPTPGA